MSCHLQGAMSAPVGVLASPSSGSDTAVVPPAACLGFTSGMHEKGAISAIGSAGVEVLEESAAELGRLLEGLPPLPRPAPHRRAEAQRGCALVILFIALAAVVVVVPPAAGATLPPFFLLIESVFFATEALLAIVCLSGLMLADSGTVKRSVEACAGIPPEVRLRLEIQQPMDDLNNIDDEASRRSFCVRCLVWRPTSAHHCRICQRCVLNFDHHCNVFGRCIGGVAPRFVFEKGCLRLRWSGNMLYFGGLCFAGATACLTGLCAVAVAVTSNLRALKNGHYAIAAACACFVCCCCRFQIMFSIRFCCRAFRDIRAR